MEDNNISVYTSRGVENRNLERNDVTLKYHFL